jgi:hypothetical protein
MVPSPKTRANPDVCPSRRPSSSDPTPRVTAVPRHAPGNGPALHIPCNHKITSGPHSRFARLAAREAPVQLGWPSTHTRRPTPNSRQHKVWPTTARPSGKAANYRRMWLKIAIDAMITPKKTTNAELRAVPTEALAMQVAKPTARPPLQASNTVTVTCKNLIFCSCRRLVAFRSAFASVRARTSLDGTVRRPFPRKHACRDPRCPPRHQLRSAARCMAPTTRGTSER